MDIWEEVENILFFAKVMLGILIAMYSIGIICGIFSLLFVVKKKHPVISICCSIVSGVFLCVPVFVFELPWYFRMAGGIAGIYGVIMLALSIRNMKKIKEEKVSLGEEEN